MGEKNHLHEGKESVGFRLLLKNTQCQKTTEKHNISRKKKSMMKEIILSQVVVLVKKQKGDSLEYEKTKGKAPVSLP